MKILIINAGNESGGGRTHIVNLLTGLNRLPKMDARLLVLEQGPVAKSAMNAGITVDVLERQSGIFSHLKEITNYINAGQFDIVHTHGARANLFLSLIYKKISATWVSTIHSDPRIDFNLKSIKGRIQFWLNRHAIKKAAHLYLMTDNFRPYLESIGYPDEKMTPIFNAIDFIDHTADKQLDDVFDIVMVARLVEVKNHLLALSALKDVEFPYKLHLVGDGEFESHLRQYVADHGLTDRVVFEGYHDDVTKYYQTADLLLLTSNTESFPFVFLEAAQYAIPAISTDVGSVSEIIASSDMGWIVPVGNKEQLIQVLNDSFNDFEAGALADKGVKFKLHIENDLTLDKLAKLMANLYESLLKGKQ